jgi:hypothetical protein
MHYFFKTENFKKNKKKESDQALLGLVSQTRPLA